MRDKLLYSFGLWAMALILFIATFILIKWAIDFATWSSLDSGWAQAIGAVAGIFLAVWVANRDSRDRRNGALVVAILAAANMQHRMQTARFIVESAIASLQKAIDGAEALGHVEKAKADLRSVPVFTAEEIGHLVPFGNSALLLAQFQSAVGNTIGLLDRTHYQTTYVHGALVGCTVDAKFMELPMDILKTQLINLDKVRGDSHARVARATIV